MQGVTKKYMIKSISKVTNTSKKTIKETYKNNELGLVQKYNEVIK